MCRGGEAGVEGSGCEGEGGVVHGGEGTNGCGAASFEVAQDGTFGGDGVGGGLVVEGAYPGEDAGVVVSHVVAYFDG